MPSIIRESTTDVTSKRVCKDCGEEKELKDFPVIKELRLGKLVFRRKCSKCYAKGNYVKHREYYRAQATENNAKRRWELTGLPPELKRCGRCKEVKNVSEFDRSKYLNRPRSVCRGCLENTGVRRERVRETNRKWEAKLRARVVKGLGGICECCGEGQYEFLSIDHKGGWGHLHRKARKKRQRAVLRDIEVEGFPREKYRVMCHNCHLAETFYGTCPHHKEFVNA